MVIASLPEEEDEKEKKEKSNVGSFHAFLSKEDRRESTTSDINTSTQLKIHVERCTKVNHCCMHDLKTPTLQPRFLFEWPWIKAALK